MSALDSEGKRGGAPDQLPRLVGVSAARLRPYRSFRNVSSFPVEARTYTERAFTAVGGAHEMIDPQVRACIAAIASAVARGQHPRTIFDYSQSRHVTLGGTYRPNSISMFDYDRGCHVSGGVSGNQLALFDYGRSAHISITVDGGRFSGFDYGTGAHFSGSVNGGSVSLYDYSDAAWTQYSS